MENGSPVSYTHLLAGDLLRRAFGGSASSLMLGALAAQRASPEELAELRKFLEEYEKGKS